MRVRSRFGLSRQGVPGKVGFSHSFVRSKRVTLTSTVLYFMTSPTASWSASQDALFAGKLRRLPAALRDALESCGMADPGLLAAYPRTGPAELGLLPADPPAGPRSSRRRRLHGKAPDGAACADGREGQYDDTTFGRPVVLVTVLWLVWWSSRMLFPISTSSSLLLSSSHLPSSISSRPFWSRVISCFLLSQWRQENQQRV